ncbi:hypothetical protein [Haloferax volcanii]|uniref:Uncharacterized protein n=3 Tax=Haloferax volcanii TaxID=2246 RepID=A0A558G8V6_HALVO|nr:MULTISPECIES: hypothetical protein [Haloferax]ELZ70259.1 hypothetical protein C456_17652 [Haloferax lucentense DSM 14919]ELZ90782.1 hypothetical protein C452_10236 [Haloferax alexandrinus JCM 10717]NLV01119.1 hypothetical protein [Haloferax alexandrinus]TVT94189.1 hypothetical protein FQA18_13275 [Haloferax volcanii]
MPALDSAVRQVGDFVVVALLLFGLTSVVAPLDLFLSSVGVEPPWFAGLVAAALVALALLLARPLRLRLVARVWGVGLVVTAVWIPLLVFLELRGNPVGILASWAAALGVGVALTYPPLWRAAEARLRVE